MTKLSFNQFDRKLPSNFPNIDMLPDVTLLGSSVDLKGLDIHYGEHFIKPMTGKGGTISISPDLRKCHRG